MFPSGGDASQRRKVKAVDFCKVSTYGTCTYLESTHESTSEKGYRSTSFCRVVAHFLWLLKVGSRYASMGRFLFCMVVPESFFGFTCLASTCVGVLRHLQPPLDQSASERETLDELAGRPDSHGNWDKEEGILFHGQNRIGRTFRKESQQRTSISFIHFSWAIQIPRILQQLLQVGLLGRRGQLSARLSPHVPGVLADSAAGTGAFTPHGARIRGRAVNQRMVEEALVWGSVSQETHRF